MNNLEIINLRKTYADFTLQDINLNIPQGTIMGLIGENGAGKTTTLKLILGLIHPEAGSIKIFGEEYVDKKNTDVVLKDRPHELGEQIGVVLAESGFPESLTAKDIEKILANIYKTWKTDAFTSYLQRFSLPDNKPLKEFSTGMKVKLSIATVLSHDSRLLILDEATSGLDPIVRDEILELFLDYMQTDKTRSILISSHITSDLEKICDVITFIRNGQVVLSQDKTSLLNQYGIIRTKESEFRQLVDQLHHETDQCNENVIIRIRKGSFGIEALIDMMQIKKPLYDQLNIEIKPATLEEIMLFFCKGEIL